VAKAVCELEAFCETCPPESEVRAALQALGFRLVFQMDAVIPPESSDIPSLPPQYHYADDYGTEIIYLAGPDTPMEGECYPRHASRFWLWSGADSQAHMKTALLLANTYHLRWFTEQPDQQPAKRVA
jgi:hypothetical protein